MSDPAILQAQQEAQALLDSHLSNLSARLFECGRKADGQLTAWITFAALTIVLCFGTTSTASISGLELSHTVAAAVTYGLSCAFYYRVVLSVAALGIWRESLRERRRLRFGTLLQIAKQGGPDVEKDTLRDFNGFVSEYPGYLAASVLIKDEAMKKGDALGAYFALVHKLVILIFSVSPYALAAAVLYVSWLSWWTVGVAAIGVAITLSANVVMVRGQNG